MAAPPCKSEDGNAAVFVGTFLEDGTSVAFCADCLAGFAGALTAQLNDIPVEVLQGIITELTTSENGQDGQEDIGEGDELVTASEGAPTDEPPGPAPADIDQEAEPPPGEDEPASEPAQESTTAGA